MRYTTVDFANLQKAKALYKATEGLVNPKISIFRFLLRSVFREKNGYIENCNDDNITILSSKIKGVISRHEFADLLTNNPKHVCKTNSFPHSLT